MSERFVPFLLFLLLLLLASFSFVSPTRIVSTYTRSLSSCWFNLYDIFIRPSFVWRVRALAVGGSFRRPSFRNSFWNRVTTITPRQRYTTHDEHNCASGLIRNKTWTTKNNTWVKASSRLFLIHLFHSVRLNYSRLYPLFVVPCFIRTTSFFNPLLKINQSIPSLYCFVRVLRLLLLLLLLYDSAIQLRVFTFRVELIFYKDKLFVFFYFKVKLPSTALLSCCVFVSLSLSRSRKREKQILLLNITKQKYFYD